MKKKIMSRVAAVGTSALILVSGLAMFTGCRTSNYPEVTITYTFNGEDYEVDYILSRVDAPKTVQHFIELADAGFYDGVKDEDGTVHPFVIHDYQDYTLKTGGYYLNDNGLVEVDYLSAVRKLESDRGITFTQSVWADEARTQPLYSVYGEFKKNGIEQENGKEYDHAEGALVMYYTQKKATDGGTDEQVWVERADGGADNDGEKYQRLGYEYNSTTSLFYTFTGESRTEADAVYCVIGMAKDYEGQLADGLLAAIEEYEESLDEEDSFTDTQENVKLNQYDYFDTVRKGGLTDDFETPVDMPIIIKSVKVTKY